MYKKLLVLLTMVLFLVACESEPVGKQPSLLLLQVDSVYFEKDKLKIQVEQDIITFDYNRDTIAFRGSMAQLMITDKKLMLQMPFEDKIQFMKMYNENKERYEESKKLTE